MSKVKATIVETPQPEITAASVTRRSSVAKGLRRDSVVPPSPQPILLTAKHEFTPDEVNHFKDAFQAFDHDGSGDIDHAELKSVLTNLGRAPSDEEIKLMIDSVDKTNSGTVNFESFLLLMWKNRVERVALEKYRESFRMLNSAGNGFMNAAELRYAMSCLGKAVNDEEIDEMIYQADADLDQKLSYDEFVAIAQRIAYDEDVESRGWETELTTSTMLLWKALILGLPTIIKQGGMAQKCVRPNRPERSRRLTTSEPKIRRVTPDVKNALQQALSLSREGDIIVLAPGKYVETNITVSIDVTITGEVNEAERPSGNQEQIAWMESVRSKVIIESSNKAGTIVIQSRYCKIQNLTIYCSGPSAAVSVEQGFPDFINCTIRGVQGGMAIKNRSFPCLQDCSLIDSAKSYGIGIRESRAIIERCFFKGNFDAGILVERSSNPWIDDCTFKDGRGCGLAFLGNSSGVLTRSRIEGNACQGVLVQEAANPVVWNNDFVNGKVTGFQASNKGRGFLVENRFKNNAITDVEIAEEGNPFVQKNKFLGGGNIAITVRDKGMGVIENNELTDYEAVFMRITKGNQTVVQHNHIKISTGTGEGRSGIYVADGTTGRIQENRVIGWPPGSVNGWAPLIVVGCGKELQVSDNVVRQAEQEGLTESIANLFGGAYVPGQGRKRTLK